MAVRNTTRKTLIAETLLNFNPHFNKTLQHLNRSGIPSGCALWINPCQSIFTVGLTNPVDIIFLDNRGKVLKVLRNFPPNCFALAARDSVSALELPSRTVESTGTEKGDILDLDPT